MQMPLILASASPRRSELLAHLLNDFSCISADINEQAWPNEKPDTLVARLALEKAQAVLKNQQAWVLGADTLIAFNGVGIGKPESLEHSTEILMQLSGRWHQVLTSLALISHQAQYQISCCTDVLMTKISQQEINEYWLSGEPQDKAGSYAIQGKGGKFVAQIRGSYSAVVGLPLVETNHLLKQAGLVT